jgi:hypothetical protein
MNCPSIHDMAVSLVRIIFSNDYPDIYLSEVQSGQITLVSFHTLCIHPYRHQSAGDTYGVSGLSLNNIIVYTAGV